MEEFESLSLELFSGPHFLCSLIMRARRKNLNSNYAGEKGKLKF